MGILSFSLHYCSMSCNIFRPNILIDKPFKSICYVGSLSNWKSFGITTVNDLCDKRFPTLEIATDGEFSPQIYVFHRHYLLRVPLEKTLIDIYTDLHLPFLSLHYFIICGGASRHYEGFTFFIPSNEHIHLKSEPHVHVKKGGFTTRYSINTCERFLRDETTREHKKAEKKIIQPFISNNKKLLLEWWELSTKGYSSPVVDSSMKQHVFSEL